MIERIRWVILRTPEAVALIYFVGGLFLLIYGFKIYRAAVILTGAVVGAILGSWAAASLGLPEWLGALVIGLALAILAWPMQKLAAFLMGGYFGVLFLLPTLAELFGQRLYILWLLVSFLSLGVLCLLLFKPIVIIATSFEGAALLVGAMLVVAWHHAPKTTIRLLSTSPGLILLALLLLSLVGFLLQIGLMEKAKKKLEK